MSSARTLPLVTRWYVGISCVPFDVQVQLTGQHFAWCPGMSCSIPTSKLFESKRDALEYAVKRKREALVVMEKEYSELADKLDAVELAEG